MMRTKRLAAIAALILFTAFLSACNGRKEVQLDEQTKAEMLHRSVQQLTDVMVHDIFSPPVASRIYAYPSVAAYEVLAQEDAAYQSLAGQLQGLAPLPAAQEEVYAPLVAVNAYLTVGKALIFTEEKIVSFEGTLYQEFLDAGLDQERFDASLRYGEQVAAHILAWAKEDKYRETRTFPKFTVSDDPSRWQPTPPVYMDAIEPHWSKIRTFVIDSAAQFAPELPTPYDLEKGSPFYEEILEVYETGNQLSDEEREIAAFWDCNPYVAHLQGHVMYASKKITPGGHWIGITKIATRKAGLDMMATAMTYAKVSVTMADAFISCWDEKYRSNLIRPETLINKYIDEDWKPALQTPPFPEYTSGHSVVSGSASVALTSILGESFHFVDSTEVKYGLPVREFDSFTAAAEEAAISRLYGGIHYMPAIENGITQGKALGSYVSEKLRFKAGE